MAYDAKEWYRHLFGILEDISEMSDSECEQTEQELTRLEADGKYNQIFKY